MQTSRILSTHPQSAAYQDALAACIESCFDCAATCTICADACLAESDPAAMAKCIRTDLDCADICLATARILSRQTHADDRVLTAQLKACHAICETCGNECDQHRDHHAHCKVCAEACHACEKACQNVLEAIR